MLITYDEPGILYDDQRVSYDGVFTDASVWPAASDVLAGVQYGPTGLEFTGDAVSGSGGTVIAYRSDVQVSTPKLHIASLKKHRTQPQERQEPAVIRARAGRKNAYATSSVSGISVVTGQPESLNVTSSTGRLDALTSTDAIYVTTTPSTASV